MNEKNLDFDTIIDRKNTNSLKYDFAKKREKPENLIPLWVADMDFKISSYIQDAIMEQTMHGIYGYSESREDYFMVLQNRMKTHYNFDIQKEWLIKTPGVVFAIAMGILAFSKKGDGILIQQPLYYCIREVIESNERRVVDNALILNEESEYSIDFEDFENKIINENVKVFVLCNPHNPIGKSWSKKDLEKMGDICLKHGVLVISDEIHADFVFEGQHYVFSTIKDAYKDISIICTAPTKTFNIAGLQISNIFIPNKELRDKFMKQISDAGYSQLNSVGIVACKAAYEYGEEWYQAVFDYINENRNYVYDYVKTNISSIKVIHSNSTFMLWFDFRSLNLSEKEMSHLIIEKAGLWLDKGTLFGSSGKGFERINVACPKSLLKKALDQLKLAVDTLQGGYQYAN